MNSQAFRLPDGGRIDRSRPLRFTFNGKQYSGFAGDTLASAMLANGVRVVGRSFKYHRPRGIFAAGVEEMNAVVDLLQHGIRRPNALATLVALSDGLSADSQHCWPSVGFDVGRVLDFTHRLWPAGFYNKTFKWPSWHWYEWLVRRSSGLGRLQAGENTGSFSHQNAHCDVLVVGSGPAGIVEALTAGRTGARVIIVEQDWEPGGSLLYEHLTIDGLTSADYLEQSLSELTALANVRLMTSATVAGYYDHNVLSVHEHRKDAVSGQTSECFWKLRARKVVLATGAIEQPLVFAHNDRPGIMLAAAVRQYLRRYGVAAGSDAVVATNNDSAYDTAFALYDAGIAVKAIVDSRCAENPLQRAARECGIEVIPGSAIASTKGGKTLRAVEICSLPTGEPQPGTRKVNCDLLAVSGGWAPTVHLFSQAGGKLRYDELLGCFVPEACGQKVRCVGGANGKLYAGNKTSPPRPERISTTGATSRKWIDYLHDVTVADIELAVRENYLSVEHMKRYTSTGMALDQGKTSNLNALSLLAELRGRKIADVGTTTFRPQFAPITLGAIAGRRTGDFYRPARTMPAHAWHLRHRAFLDDYGGWKRPTCYLQDGESRHDAAIREALAVRRSLGLFEGSPLGKIEVTGPDAAEFLNRIYVNNVLTLKTGAVRYGMMLNENGIIIDDGVFARLAKDRFIISTTSGGADRIASWLEEWHQCQWPNLRLVICTVTTQWAVLTLAGPNARKALQKLDCDIDLSAQAFPHMNIRAGNLQATPVRIQRVSFTGELSFEISLPADCAESLWSLLMDVGSEFDICPFGVDATMTLRIEKGYLHVGGDTDGTTNPMDVGFAGIIGKKTTDFIGKRSLSRPHDQQAGRRQLVGIEPVDKNQPLVAGAHIVEENSSGMRSQGFVTSACFSPTLGKYIALGMLENGFGRKGEAITLFDDGASSKARIVDPVFFDPSGTRMRDQPVQYAE